MPLKYAAVFSLHIQNPAFILTLLELDFKIERLKTLYLITKLKKNTLRLTTGTKRQKMSLWLVGMFSLLCQRPHYEVKSNPLRSGLINKTFLVTKSQINLSIPTTFPWVFLDSFSMHVPLSALRQSGCRCLVYLP